MTAHYMNDERRMIQEIARDFSMREVLPVANELDPVQGKIPMELRRKMGEMGYFGIRMAEQHGGSLRFEAGDQGLRARLQIRR